MIATFYCEVEDGSYCEVLSPDVACALSPLTTFRTGKERHNGHGRSAARFRSSRVDFDAFASHGEEYTVVA